MLRVHLQVVLRVPVWVEYDTDVGGGEVDAQTSCSCTEEEHEAVRVHFTEAIDGSLPEIPSNSPVNTFIRIPTCIIQISDKKTFPFRIFILYAWKLPTPLFLHHSSHNYVVYCFSHAFFYILMTIHIRLYIEKIFF